VSLTRCPVPDREHLVDVQQIQHPGYRRCGSSSVTLPARVLTFMAAIISVLIDAEPE
jgi:hypothetical protein